MIRVSKMLTNSQIKIYKQVEIVRTQVQKNTLSANNVKIIK